MPEFVQEDLEPIQQLTINFEHADDIQEFSKLVDQKITDKTKSIWYPKVEKERPSKFIYVDES